MKKMFTGILLTLMMFSLILSCTFETEKPGKTGALVLNFPMAKSRTLLPDIDMTPASYDINGTGPNGAAFSITSDQPTVEITALDFGEWTVTADAINEDGIIIGHGEATCTVHVGETTAVTITVIPLDGYGSVDLTVNWNAGDTEYPTIEAQLLPSSGSPIDLTFTITGGNTGTCVRNNIPTGYYTLTIKLLDGNPANITPILTMGAVEIVKIVKDETTNGTFDFTQINQPGGTIQVNIDLQMADPIDVIMEGQFSQIGINSAMTVDALVPSGVGNVTCLWYINGELKETGSNYTISGLLEGIYRLDLTAFTSDGKRAGSCSAQFEVNALEYPVSTLIKYYYSTSVDGMWFTQDDMMNGYDRKEYLNYWSDNSKQYGKWGDYDGSGPDGIWITGDDIPSGWWRLRSETGGTWQDGPGLDGIWFNDDDNIQKWEVWSDSLYNRIFYNPGPDGIWFTGDEEINAYYYDEYDTSGNTIKRVYYNNPGLDGQWFTGDDVIGVDWFGAYFIAEYEGEMNRWWSWTKFISYDGAGDDGVWFTADDTIKDFRTHEFGDGNKFFTKEVVYSGLGADGIMFTTDDVINSYAIAINTYFDGHSSQINLGTPVSAWIQNPQNGHYYILTPYLSWEEAELYANASGNHLVTINDEEENLCLVNIFGSTEAFWIGFNDTLVEGQWEWVSGEESNFTNWYQHIAGDWEPNDSGEGEDAATINYYDPEQGEIGPGKWNDIPVSSESRGIVEKNF